MARDRWLFRLLRPLHARPIGLLATPEIVKVLRVIQDTGDRREIAHRCARPVTRISRFAVQSEPGYYGSISPREPNSRTSRGPSLMPWSGD